MRHWLLVIMVLLLPLRGLAGVAMAGQMLEQHAAVAPAGHGSHHAGPQRALHEAGPERALHDCDDHHGGSPAAAAEGSGDLPEDCPTCASCQVCSAAVLAPSLLPAFGETLPQAPPALAVHAPASAEPALALKPPQS
jgi:hypothetical protein